MHERAGTPARDSDLVDVEALVHAYFTAHPDPTDPAQRVVFGTSGHRGSALTRSFNEDHIAATTQAIVDRRAADGVTGPLFLGADTHALSAPALTTALTVLAGNGVRVLVDEHDDYVPTPALSRAILRHNDDADAVAADGPADGIVVTPSHNPPADGGFKYNPPHGGPAGSEATRWIAERANGLLAERLRGVLRAEPSGVETYDFRARYVEELDTVIDMEAIRDSRIRLGADPLGGAGVHYWAAIAERYGLDLTVVNPTVDPAWGFMTLDWDGRIRMDPSSRSAMAGALGRAADFDILTGNDADADRHGVITPDAGLMNPNHYLTVAVDYLLGHRPGWPSGAAVGKTVVSSRTIDRVVADHGRTFTEVPVGFKWFVPGLRDGSVCFGGEESAGASFLTRDGRAWTTDKDGILLALLAAEIRAVTGASPSERYRELAGRLGDPSFERVDAAADPERRARLGALGASEITATQLAGDPVVERTDHAPGNGAAIGGVRIASEHAWFAARPSGTENVYKIYAESFRGPEHLRAVQEEARRVVDAALAG